MLQRVRSGCRRISSKVVRRGALLRQRCRPRDFVIRTVQVRDVRSYLLTLEVEPWAVAYPGFRVDGARAQVCMPSLAARADGTGQGLTHRIRSSQAPEIAALWVRACHKEAHIWRGSLGESVWPAIDMAATINAPTMNPLIMFRIVRPYLLARVLWRMPRPGACFCDDGENNSIGSRWLPLCGAS